ncbi:MAG: bacterial transcriptional activator domain-containing protein [Anaerolineae bacterium]|nr:bacterial transcriptional activator domain-containing protein [Anaerolineae bacterium]
MLPENQNRVEALAATAAQAVYNKTQNKRIIILYPRHRQHTALISLLYKHYADRMYYYALNEEDDTLKNFLWNLSHDAMFPIEFGEHLRVALQNSTDSEQWAEAFGADLAGLRPEKFMLLLDHLDMLPRSDEKTHKFFRALPHYMPHHAQLIINGRELRRQPWNDLINEGLAISLGDDEALNSGIFHEPEMRGQLEVYALAGGSRVLIDGRPITAWEGSLPRDLFYFFVDKPMLTRTEIFETFWPELKIKEATNVFHVTKRKISEKLAYDLTSYENGFYIPNQQVNRIYDAEIFEKHIEAAIDAVTDAEEEDNWARAIQIYRGQFLKEVNRPWAQQRRAELRNSYAQALISLARIYKDRREYERALGYFIRAIGEKPDREDVHRDIMTIYADQGRSDAVHQQYKMLENVLSERLKIAPSQGTRELYAQLTR